MAKAQDISVIDKAVKWKCRRCEHFIKLTWERQHSKRIYFMCDAVEAELMSEKDLENLKKCPIK